MQRIYKNKDMRKIEPPFSLGVILYSAGLVAGTLIGVYAVVFKKISKDPFNIWLYFLGMTSLALLLIYVLSLKNKFRKYIVAKEFEVLDDRVVYKSIKGLKFVVRFEDIVVIFNVDATVGPRRRADWIVGMLVFYNRERKKYQQMRVLKEDMKEVVDRYLEWCKKNSRPAVPIYRGNVDPSFNENRLIKKHIKEFEERLKGNVNIPPPPPWLKEN